MKSLKNQKPATLFKSDGRLYVTVATEMAEALCTYLRFHTINATLPDLDGTESVTLRIDDTADTDIVQPLVDNWNQEVYGTSAGDAGAKD